MKFYKLDKEITEKYISDKFVGNTLYFADLIGKEINTCQGEFYAIVENSFKGEPFIYEFDAGGRVNYENRTHNHTPKFIENISANKVIQSCIQYIDLNQNNYICSEEFTIRIKSEFVKKYRSDYYAIDGRVVYILNNKFDKSIIEDSLSIVGGCTRLIIYTKINANQERLEIKEEVPQEIKDEMFNNIQAFALETYDGDSYIIWIKSGCEYIKDIIDKRL